MLQLALGQRAPKLKAARHWLPQPWTWRCYTGQPEGGMLASRRKRATASGKQWRKKCAATILGEVHAARAVVPGRARWQRRGHTQAVRLGDAIAGGTLTRLAGGSVPRLLASSGGKSAQPRFWARCDAFVTEHHCARAALENLKSFTTNRTTWSILEMRPS